MDFILNGYFLAKLSHSSTPHYYPHHLSKGNNDLANVIIMPNLASLSRSTGLEWPNLHWEQRLRAVNYDNILMEFHLQILLIIRILVLYYGGGLVKLRETPPPQFTLISALFVQQTLPLYGRLMNIVIWDEEQQQLMKDIKCSLTSLSQTNVLFAVVVLLSQVITL